MLLGSSPVLNAIHLIHEKTNKYPPALPGDIYSYDFTQRHIYPLELFQIRLQHLNQFVNFRSGC